MKSRLPVSAFNLPVEEIHKGYYSDIYFVHSKAILEKDRFSPHVIMQVFQRQSAVLCGIDQAVAILKTLLGQPGKTENPCVIRW